MKGNDNAFPSSPDRYEPEFGLTKRELIAAMAMKGLLANPGFREDVVHGRIARMAIDEANNLIYHLNADPAEGVNLLPMHSSELDEGLTDDK
jgi:hypothetical protein